MRVFGEVARDVRTQQVSLYCCTTEEGSKFKNMIVGKSHLNFEFNNSGMTASNVTWFYP